MLELIRHSLGLCSDSHPTIFIFLSYEFDKLPGYYYIKDIFKKFYYNNLCLK